MENQNRSVGQVRLLKLDYPKGVTADPRSRFNTCSFHVSIYVFIDVFIYIYIEREREVGGAPV